jgi:hypothetical protein
MRPVRNMSASLREVMHRSGLRGARLECDRSFRIGRSMHEAAHLAGPDATFEARPEASSRASAELLPEPRPRSEPAGVPAQTVGRADTARRAATASTTR